MAQSAWETVLAKKKADLDQVLTHVKRKQNARYQLALDFNDAMNSTDFVYFEAALNRICDRQTDGTISRLIRSKLHPHLKHIQSLATAVSAATQSQAAVALTWGCTLIVVQVNSLEAHHRKTNANN